MQTVPILYQDENFVFIDKPSGLLTHKSAWAPGVEENALQSTRDAIGCWVYPVHRLDRPTSGVLAFGLSEQAAAALSSKLTHGEVEKTYYAIARGWLPLEGFIDHPVHDPDDKNKKTEAQTRYRTLFHGEIAEPVGRYQSARYSLVEVTPLTGRTHQIRQHLEHLRHPIVGDTVYGDGKQNRFFRERFGISRLLLHARAFSFSDVLSGKNVAVQAAWPEEFKSLAAQFGWNLEACTRLN